MTKPYLITVILFFFVARLFAQAPSISYAGPQTYNAFAPVAPLVPVSSGVATPGYSATAISLGSGFNKPSNVAIDAAGNIYVADAGNNAVKKIPIGGGAPITIGSGFNDPTAVAVDAAGNVYVADFGNKAVKKIPVGGGAPITIGSGFRFPFDVEVDAVGNVFVGDNNTATVPNGGASNVFVKEIPANGDAVFNVSGDYFFIKEIAFDATGNNYVADANGSPYIEETFAGLHNASLPNFVGPNFSFKIAGVAIDATGNRYVTDGSSNKVTEVPANGGTPFLVGPVFGTIGGIKADAVGNLYIADAGSTTIAEIKPIGGYYISPALPLGLNFDNATGTISGTPTVGSPATIYTITVYNSAGVSTTVTVNIKVNIPAPVITYNSPSVYATGSAITPLAPTSKNVDVLDYKKTIIEGSGFANPFAVAVDSKGNIYVTDTGHGLIKKIPAGGGSPVTIGSGSTSPEGIAVDAIGNVYVTDPQVNKAYEIPANGSPQVSIGTALNQPLGIAVDNAGNIYIGNSGNNTLIKIPADGTPQVNLRSGVNTMGSIAVDDNGNIYESDGNFASIAKVPANGDAIVNFNGSLSNSGVTVDAAGNIYTVDNVGNTLQKIIEDGSSQNPGSVLTLAGFNQPNGIAIDKSGNLYVADKGNNEVKKITPNGGYFLSPALPAGLNFNNTTGIITGTPTVVTPARNYTVTVYNSSGSSSTTFSIATITPTITASTAIGNISSCTGAASASPNIQQFTVSGSGLSANITITAPVGFEISLSAASGYSSNLSITQSSGTVNSTTVYVRSAPSAPIGNLSGSVILTCPSIPNQNVAVTGIVRPLATVNTVGNQTLASGNNTTAINFTGTGNTYSWVNTTPGIGLAGNGTGNIVPFKALNTTSAPVTATITATPQSAGLAYIADAAFNVVYVYNGLTFLPLDTIKVGTSPIGVSLSPDGTRLYVANELSGSVSVINTATNKVVATIIVGSNPLGILVSADGSRIYVVNNVSNNVSVISAATNNVVATIPVGNNPQGVTISPDGSRVYIANHDGTVMVINSSTNTVTNTIAAGSNLTGITTSPDGSKIYVGTAGTSIAVINTSTNTVIATIPVGTNPNGVSISPDGNRLYVANSFSNTVSVINTATNTVVATIPVGAGAYGVSLSSDGSRLFVACPSAAGFSVVNTATNTVLSNVMLNNLSGPFSFGNFVSAGVDCSGIPITFSITVNPALLPTITTTPATGTIIACSGNVSVSPSIQQFTVSGSNLTADLTITAPSGFEVSISAADNYNSAVTLLQSGGTINSTVIYVRAAHTAPVGTISGNMVLSSTGLASQNVAVSGTINALPTINGIPDQTVASGTQVEIPAFTGTASTYSWINDTSDIGLSTGGTGNIPSFTATNNTNSPLTATITVSPSSATGCSGTPVTIKITVIPTFTLPQNNFKLAITSATCKGNSDGSVNITATQSEAYTATITGNGLNTSYPFTTSAGINNLAAGTYHICVTVAGQADFSQCYDAVVTEPKDLSVYSVINSDNSLTLALSGGTQYNIQLNGQTYTTTDNSITLPMAEGNNDLTVTTDRLCQGSYKKLINISGNITPYPDPFQNTLSLNIGNAAVNNVNVEIHNVSDGKLVFTKQYVNQSGVLELDLTNLQGGVYALHLSMDNTEKIYKIIKK